jgi:hypothetical protein
VVGIATLTFTKSVFNVSRRHATVDPHRHLGLAVVTERLAAAASMPARG